MEFFDALGLPGADRAPQEVLVAALAVSRAPTLATLVAVPDPVVICEKLLRLDRYCATGVRLALTASSAQSLSLRAVEPADAAAIMQRVAVLRAVLLRAGFAQVTHSTEAEMRATLRWSEAPDVPPLDTGGSARLTDHLHRLIASDPARAWRIQDAAQHLGLSSRSLQRYLLAEGGTFSAALRQVRTEVAATLLRKSALTLAEIGFCCGYADQAHFQREFRKVCGLTPRRFRKSGATIQKLVRTAP